MEVSLLTTQGGAPHENMEVLLPTQEVLQGGDGSSPTHTAGGAPQKGMEVLLPTKQEVLPRRT